MRAAQWSESRKHVHLHVPKPKPAKFPCLFLPHFSLPFTRRDRRHRVRRSRARRRPARRRRARFWRVTLPSPSPQSWIHLPSPCHSVEPQCQQVQRALRANATFEVWSSNDLVSVLLWGSAHFFSVFFFFSDQLAFSRCFAFCSFLKACVGESSGFLTHTLVFAGFHALPVL